MKIEIKNWVGVVVLLCLGFIFGRVSVLSDVNANPQDSEIGRYQLVAGTYTNTHDGKETKTVFRIDTATGRVEQWDYLWGTTESKDYPIVWSQQWKGLTEFKFPEPDSVMMEKGE